MAARLQPAPLHHRFGRQRRAADDVGALGRSFEIVGRRGVDSLPRSALASDAACAAERAHTSTCSIGSTAR